MGDRSNPKEDDIANYGGMAGFGAARINAQLEAEKAAEKKRKEEEERKRKEEALKAALGEK